MERFIYKSIFTVAIFVFCLGALCLWTLKSPDSESTLSAPLPAPTQSDDGYENKNFPMLEMSALKVNGVELDSPYSKVVQAFGKPLRRKKGAAYDECGGGYRETLYFPGITVDLLSDQKGKNYAAASIEVTSAKWLVSGIRIGADIRDVQSKFRNSHDKTKNDNGLDVLTYWNGDGWIVFSFKKDKLAKISWEYNFC